MKLVRKLHLFLSVFFAPLLIFYIGTGWYQTFTINRNKSLGEADDLVSKLTSVHVDQGCPRQGVLTYKTLPFKLFVALMSICLLVTIALGIFLAFRTSRIKWPVWSALFFGLILPALILWFGQRK